MREIPPSLQEIEVHVYPHTSVAELLSQERFDEDLKYESAWPVALPCVPEELRRASLSAHSPCNAHRE